MMNIADTARPVQVNKDFEVQSLDMEETAPTRPWWTNFQYLLMGLIFGIILIKSEVVSWFRIQEMFRLQSFHMYGVLGSAVTTGIISIWLIKKFNIKTIRGERIQLTNRKFSKGQVYGGLLFGFGWAITGACPGPLFAQLGTGITVTIVTIFSAIAGTWVYGLMEERLPH